MKTPELRNMHGMVRRAKNDTDVVLLFDYTDQEGIVTKRVTSPIRVNQSGESFLALCFSRERPSSFRFDRCENMRIDKAHKYMMPTPLEVVEPERSPEAPKELPVKAGWSVDLCGDRCFGSGDEKFRTDALELLYATVVARAGGIMLPEDTKTRDRRRRMIDELAVELVGGTPECFEQYT